MTRRVKVVAAVFACLLMMSAVAIAALPRPGRVYKGTSTAAHKVKIVAETQHNLSLLRVVDSCDTVTKWTDVRVKADGTFKAVKKSGEAVYYTVTGKFTRRSKAKGSISQVTCEGQPGDYVARIQPQ